MVQYSIKEIENNLEEIFDLLEDKEDHVILSRRGKYYDGLELKKLFFVMQLKVYKKIVIFGSCYWYSL